MRTNVPISVLMTVYNGEVYLREAIDSILNQTFSDFEFIIVDDDSTDDTIKIIESYNDARIRLIRNKENLGTAASRNKGIKASKGKYIAMMDADDISLPERFEKQFHFMEMNPEIDACGSIAKKIGKAKGLRRVPLKHDDIFSGFLFGCKIVQSSSFLKKSAITDRRLYYDPDIKYCEDTDFWIRLGLLGAKFANLNEVLLNYRWHKQNTNIFFEQEQKNNSAKTRLHSLKRINIKDPKKKIITHTLLRSGKVLSKEGLDGIANWIDDVVAANRKEKLFNEKSLKKGLSKSWQKACYNSCHHGIWVWNICYKHPISDFFALGLKMKLKFMLCCIFKVNSKKVSSY